MLLTSIQPPISTIPCKIVYSLANPMLLFPMFSSPADSPTNRSLRPRPSHSNRCHPERSEGSAFLSCLDTRHSPLFMQKVRIDIIPRHLMHPLFSYSYALFCTAQSAIPNSFSNFRTLCPKHPGWGAAINFFVAQTSVCALLRQSTSERSEAKDPQQLKNLAILPVISDDSRVTASALFRPSVTSRESPVIKSCRIRTYAKRACNSRRIRTYGKTREGGASR
jgi:hypothetical protein